MITTFLSHTTKRLLRSSSAGKELATKTTLGIIMLILAGYTLALGFSLKTILVDVLKQDNPIGFLNGLLFYFFLTGFVTRYFLQSLPVLDAQPYLHLPIARNRIVHFLLGRSLVHIANIYIFLLFTPFAMTVTVTTRERQPTARRLRRIVRHLPSYLQRSQATAASRCRLTM